MSGVLRNPTVEIISVVEVSALAAEIVSVAKKGATALSALASGFEVVNEIISLASPATGIESNTQSLRWKLFPSQTMRSPNWQLHRVFKAKLFRFETPFFGYTRRNWRGSVNLPFTPVAKQPRQSLPTDHADAAAAILPIA